MKKILTVVLAAAMALSITACGKNKVTNADMNKVEGNALEEVKDTAKKADTNSDDDSSLEEASDDSKPEAKAVIDEFEIEIGNAKLIDSVDGKAVVIEFTFKNNTSHPKSYDGIFDETVVQGDKELLGATVVDKIEGFDPLSATTEINAGDTASVQKAYALYDETTDITVTAYRYDEPEKGTATKTFKIN